MAILSGTRAPGPAGASAAAAAPTKSPHMSTRARNPTRRTYEALSVPPTALLMPSDAADPEKRASP